jgi:pimeloyl-ACP methyl ester carboxylesterase
MASLVILPGWNNTGDTWRDMIEKFSAHNPQITELPGFGKIPIIDSSWGVSDYARFAVALIEKQNLQEVVLVGHSFGGRLAAEIASSNPPWLKAVILYAAPCIYRPATKTKIIIRLAKIAKRIGIRSKSFYPNQELLEAEKLGLGQIYRNVIGYDQTEQLKKIATPTLILWGAEDLEAPVRLAPEMQQLIQNSELEIVDKAGHQLHLTHPHLFYGKLQQFIQSL